MGCTFVFYLFTGCNLFYYRNGLQMGLFVRLWVIIVIFNAFRPLWVAYRFMMCDISIFAGCGLLFGLYGWIYAPPPHPTPKTSAPKSGCLSKKFFWNFIFLFFQFVFCWLFLGKKAKNWLFSWCRSCTWFGFGCFWLFLGGF